VEEKTTVSKLLPWIVLGLTALGLFYFVEKGCGKSADASADIQPRPIDTAAIAPAPEESNPMRTYTLPGGVDLKAIPGSFTGDLAEFLASTATGEKCFTFDNVEFESGSFKIAAGSEAQLGELATLMKAYPDAKVSIEGHTDDEGDDGKNKSLSKERAKVIKTWLTEHEIAPGRIDAKGLGEEKPIATNKTEAGRDRNRRVEVCLKKK